MVSIRYLFSFLYCFFKMSSQNGLIQENLAHKVGTFYICCMLNGLLRGGFAETTDATSDATKRDSQATTCDITRDIMRLNIALGVPGVISLSIDCFPARTQMSLCSLTIQYLESQGFHRLTGVCPVSECGFHVACHRDENVPLQQVQTGKFHC